MNRAEQSSGLNKIEENGTMLILSFAIPVKVLHEHYGFGAKKRLPEFTEYMIDEYERFIKGGMTVEECKDMVYDLCGVTFYD